MLNRIRLYISRPEICKNSTKILSNLRKYNNYYLDVLPSYQHVTENNFSEMTKIPYSHKNYRNQQTNNLSEANCMLVLPEVNEETVFKLGYI